MLKKFNIFALALLIIGQTILGPMNTVSAEGFGMGTPDSDDKIAQVGDNTGEPVETVEPVVEEALEPDSIIDTSEQDPPTITEDYETEDKPEAKEDGEQSFKNGKGDEGELSKEKLGIVLFNAPPPPAGTMPPEDVMKNTEFKVGGQPVTGTGPITVKNGQTAEFKFNLEQTSGHSYGPGTTMTYTLPDIFTNIIFTQGTKFGDLGEITKNGNAITITFNDGIHDGLNGTGFEPGAHFFITATFNNTGDNVNETINLPGLDNIALNFTPLNGKPITKDNGAPKPTNQNSDRIEWEVTVNTDLAASDTVEFKDTLTGGHTFDLTTVKITELTMKPDGTVASSSDVTASYSPNFNVTNTEMTIDLDGTKAYEITYNTIPDDPGNNESVKYQNSAQYGTLNTGTKTATVGYGTPLSKESSGPNANLETTWTIKYNFNKRTISELNAELTDNWSTTGGSGTGTQVMSDFNVYEEDGTTPVDASEYTKTDNGEGFTLKFNQDVTKPYVVKYKTTPNVFFATSNFTVKNTVTRSDIEITRNPSVTYNKTTFLLNKSAGNVDYANKTIPWTITANQAGYSLNANTTFTDTFTNENMTLKEETLVVKVGNTELTKGGGYSLVNNGKEGFDITLTNSTSERVVITYTTDYDIKDVGSNTRQFQNEIAINNSGLPDVPSDSATRSVAAEQTANGKKDGKYNYATKQFEWEVELNFNLNTLTDAIFEDVLPETQTIDVSSIKVYEGTLNAAGQFQQGNEVSVTNTATEPNEIQFPLGNITGPYKVTYTSHDTDGVYPEITDKVQIKNNATLTDGGTPNASWTKTVGVNYTDKLITKKGSQIASTAGIKWSFEFNYAQSDLKNIVITDTVGKDGEGNPNQLIKADSFKVYQVALSGKSDNANFNASQNKTEISNYGLDVNIQAGTFELRLPDGISTYYIEYETIYIGDNNSTVQNEVQVNYVSNDGNQASNNFSISNFKYGNAGTTVKVPFVVVKTDGATGEPMADVEFTLYSDFQPGVPLISKKTDANGIFDLGMKLTEGKYTLKETDVTGYDNPGDIDFTLHRDSVATSGPHVNKQIVEVENFKTGAQVCPVFTLTIKGLDGNPITAGQKVTLTNKVTGEVVDSNHSGSTNASGAITLVPTYVKAGVYTVIVEINGTPVDLGDIQVNYDSTATADCKGEVGPLQVCPIFTLTVNDRSGNPHNGVTVIVKDASDNKVAGIDANGASTTIFTTDANGEVTFPYVIEPGTYKVYEVDANSKEKLINSFTVTDTCDASIKPSSGGGGGWVPPAPTCDVFTITVKQDGKIVDAGTELALIDSTGKTVKTGKTDATGKIVIDKKDLPEGSYKAYDKDGKEVGTITVTYEEGKCHADINLLPAGPTCERFTITVKESGEVVKAGTIVTLKDHTGKTVATGTTNAAGKMVFEKANLPEGSYKAYDKDGKEVGTITVTYEEGKCQASIDLLPKVCKNFTLTIVDTPNASVEVKDSNGATVVTGTTESNGKVVFNKPITEGNYVVFADGKKISSITVTKDCEATVTPGVDPIDPDPEKPTDPPTDPNKPGTNPDGGDKNPGGVKPDGGNNNPGGVKPDGGNNTPGGNVKPGSGDKTDSGNVAGQGGWKDKLPKTGEEQFMYMIALGVLFLVVGGVVLFRQRRKA